MSYIIVTESEKLARIAKTESETMVYMVKNNTCSKYGFKTKTDVFNFLKSLGISPKLNGYKYIEYILTNDIEYKSITNELYPTLSDIFNTTPNRAERNIRHAISYGWEHGDPNFQEKIFGCSNLNKTPPTNSDFIKSILAFYSLN